MKHVTWFIMLMSWMAHAQQTSPVVDPNKFTICAITINSDDEKKLFQAQAAKYPKKFNPVVELTDFGEDDWFKKSCESGIRCDQLVISGHYAGGFFGENGGKRLSPKELEEAGCSKTCEGVMKNPYEVFLFGCNTLATKDADHRTPAQYLQVLLQDGIPLAQAEMVVQTRYSEIGDSTKATMQRSFAGDSKHIYGFHSVGPSGKNVKGFLQNYFSKINSADHLEKLQAKRMLGQVDAANKLLADSLKTTAFTQCNEASDQDEKTKKICTLVNGKVSDDIKLDLVLELLSQNDYLTYLPSIGHYMKGLNKEKLTPSQKASMELIQNNETIKNQIIGLADKTQGMGLKAEWLSLASNIGFISEEEVASRIKPQVLKLLEKPLNAQTMEDICSVSSEYGFLRKLNIKDSETKNKNVGLNEVLVYDCLDIKDPAMILRMTQVDLKGDSDLKFTVFNMAVKNLPSGTKVTGWMKEYLSDVDLDYQSKLQAMAKFFPTDPIAINIAKDVLINAPYASEVAIETLKRFNAVEQHSDQIMKLLKDNNSCEACLTALMDLKGSPKVQMFLSRALDPDHRIIYGKESSIFRSLNLPTSEPVIKERVENYIKENYHNFMPEDWKQVESSGFQLTPEMVEWQERLRKYSPETLP